MLNVSHTASGSIARILPLLGIAAEQYCQKMRVHGFPTWTCPKICVAGKITDIVSPASHPLMGSPEGCGMVPGPNSHMARPDGKRTSACQSHKTQQGHPSHWSVCSFALQCAHGPRRSEAARWLGDRRHLGPSPDAREQLHFIQSHVPSLSSFAVAKSVSSEPKRRRCRSSDLCKVRPLLVQTLHKLA